MTVFSQNILRNRLLKSMPPTSFQKLAPHLTIIDLPVKLALVEIDQDTEHAYFLESGIASIVAASVDHVERVEVGHIGREGMSGFHVILGTSRTPNRTFMQAVGVGLRIPSAVLVEAVDSDPALRRMLLRYIHSYQIQLAHSALANGRYSIKERLARWLLMCHDRIDGDDLPMTHEFLSLMLGVRRSGITDEIHVSEGLGLIKAKRGHIHMLDRAKMVEVAGSCYGLPEREYERLIGGTDV